MYKISNHRIGRLRIEDPLRVLASIVLILGATLGPGGEISVGAFAVVSSMLSLHYDVLLVKRVCSMDITLIIGRSCEHRLLSSAAAVS